MADPLIFDLDATFETGLTEVYQSTTGVDHRKLAHRDKPDQHPIEAITDLAGELEQRPSTALSNLEIQEILSQ